RSQALLRLALPVRHQRAVWTHLRLFAGVAGLARLGSVLRAAVNHTSPFWPYFSHLADYVNRASYILQRGKPVADVALYLPAEDAMAEAEVGELMLNWAVRDRMSTTGPPPEFGLKDALRHEADVVKTIITNGCSFDGWTHSR